MNSSPQLGWRESHITGDSDSGISSNYTYTTAVNVKGSNHTVNGVNFTGSSSTSGYGWSITQGFTSGHTGRTSTVDGQIGSMLSDGLRFGGNQSKLKIIGLTHGEIYTFSLFSQAWGSQKIINLSSSDHPNNFTADQDKYHSAPQDGLSMQMTQLAGLTYLHLATESQLPKIIQLRMVLLPRSILMYK
jgi:hypothetical protein